MQITPIMSQNPNVAQSKNNYKRQMAKSDSVNFKGGSAPLIDMAEFCFKKTDASKLSPTVKNLIAKAKTYAEKADASKNPIAQIYYALRYENKMTSAYLRHAKDCHKSVKTSYCSGTM